MEEFYCKLRFYLDRLLFFIVDVIPFLFIHAIVLTWLALISLEQLGTPTLNK